ncbi:uncharacterized protein LOC124927104 [Impatiens glandulifera]|uniref:uncharacterized protein LOC124927104 n=1 Tax=Impatiens glandulifera TaxID=253017 RepID=UPI001FB187FD|nr:uncharacterized protein LOC124927104 [Impatiens glandulifera]
MPRTSSSFLRQLSGKESWKSTSNRWPQGINYGRRSGGEEDEEMMRRKQMEQAGLGFGGMYGNQQGMLMMRKRVMVVVDESSHSKHAMMWALTHVTDKGDLLTLLHILPHPSSPSSSLATSLASLCKACKPEVEIEAVVVQGPKIGTIMSQVKKLEVSVLVLGQKKPSSLLLNCLIGERRSNGEEIVEECINTMECLTIGVRKQSKSVGGYLISTRWQKNFWLLA